MRAVPDLAKLQEAMQATKRPCRYCGREIVASGMTTHEPACSPEAREARRIRTNEFAARYRRGPLFHRRYAKKPCPSCGVEIHESSAMCRSCRDAAGKPERRRPLEVRFWTRVSRGSPDECWPYIGARSQHGYGRVRTDDERTATASRIAYRLAVGDPGGLSVLHRCDNPPCCNPSHLFLGTQADNMRDAARKGRLSGRRRVA